MPQMSAALSFYSLLSIGPLLLIATSVAGSLWGHDAATGQVLAEMQNLIGKAGAEAMQHILLHAQQPYNNLFALMIGIATLFISASGVFIELQDALNVIWRAPPSAHFKVGDYLKHRLLSFAIVFGVGFLLMVSLLLSAILTAIGTFLTGTLPSLAPLLEIFNSIASFFIVSLLFAMIFKILPDIYIAWHDVWMAAGVSSFLFTIGKHLIGLYLGSSALSTTYGAAGSFMIFAVWVYYSSHILFFGAEFASMNAVKARKHKG